MNNKNTSVRKYEFPPGTFRLELIYDKCDCGCETSVFLIVAYGSFGERILWTSNEFKDNANALYDVKYEVLSACYNYGFSVDVEQDSPEDWEKTCTFLPCFSLFEEYGFANYDGSEDTIHLQRTLSIDDTEYVIAVGWVKIDDYTWKFGL